MTPEELEKTIQDLPSLPEVALRVVQISSTPDFELADLVAVVRTDPGLTARILKLCNSSLFGLKNPVTTVDDALPYLGTRNILKIVISTCTRSFFSEADASYLARPGELWRHSVACGLAAHSLATTIGIEETGAAFTAGILHNIGKVALSRALAGHATAFQRADGPARDFLEIERRALGMDHAAAGALVAKRWPLPNELRRAIVNHHDTDRIADDPPLTAIIHLADILCLQAGIGVGIDGLSYVVAGTAIERVGLRPRDIDRTRLQLIDELRRHEDLVKLHPAVSR